MRRCFFLFSFCVALGACGDAEHQNMQQWMTQSSRDLRPTIPKLPEVEPYEPVPYQEEAKVDPFRASKIEPEIKSQQNVTSGMVRPDFEAREVRNNLLEKYPLESLKMIGVLNINNHPMAVIKVEDKVGQVKVGDYIGRDFGKVLQVMEGELKLKEMIQDSAGDWVERDSSLYLQSTEGGAK